MHPSAVFERGCCSVVMQADVFSLGCAIAEVLGKQLASSEIITTGTTAEYYRWAQRCVLDSLSTAGSRWLHAWIQAASAVMFISRQGQRCIHPG